MLNDYDNSEPIYANITETFVKLMGYVTYILKFDSYEGSFKEYNDILSKISTWALVYEKNRDLSFINSDELLEIYKRIDSLQTKYICSDSMGSESEFSDYVVNWMWHLMVLVKNYNERKGKDNVN